MNDAPRKFFDRYGQHRILARTSGLGLPHPGIDARYLTVEELFQAFKARLTGEGYDARALAAYAARNEVEDEHAAGL